VNNILRIFILLIFISSCSLDTKSGLWSKTEKIKKEKKVIIKEQFKKEAVLESELNPNLKVNLPGKLIKNSFINNLNNNNGQIEYNGDLKKTSRFKFSKIDNFNQYEPKIVFTDNNVIFFDNKVSILKFDNLSKLIWKRNYYSKNEKKSKPILFFGNNKDKLIVADNIAKYYAINIKTGDLLWSKNNSSPFNSQVKVYKENFFVVDFQNILRCFSLKDGLELWNYKTDQSFIKSQKKLSLIIVNNKVIFNNSIGDVTAINVNNGNLIWQTPTQSSAIYEDSFSLKTSDLIANDHSVLFSNNRNEFFSLDVKNGAIRWKQKINSHLRSTLIENTIISITNEGYLVLTDNRTGNIIRINYIFKEFRQKGKIFKEFKPKRKFVKRGLGNLSNEKTLKVKGTKNPVGFIVGSKKIYLTTDHGRLLVIDIKSGKVISILKIDNEKISRPFVLNKNLFIIKDNSIIKLD
jgi:outer membrane protein assembly factor BamB